MLTLLLMTEPRWKLSLRGSKMAVGIVRVNNQNLAMPQEKCYEARLNGGCCLAAPVPDPTAGGGLVFNSFSEIILWSCIGCTAFSNGLETVFSDFP